MQTGVRGPSAPTGISMGGRELLSAAEGIADYIAGKIGALPPPPRLPGGTRMLSQRGNGVTRPARAVKDLFVPALLATALFAMALAVAAWPAGADGVRDAQQWVLDDLRAPQAWATSQGRGITVAVLDSGVDPAVSDLAGSVTTGPDYTRAGTAPSNPHWGEHGTWMASLIAGHGHGGGGSGILGVAPQSRILSIRVITDRDDPGYEHYQHEQPDEIQNALASAIRYAVRHGAAVISMSIGYSEPSTAVRSALQYADAHGTVVVASSGNSGDSWFARTHSYAPYSFPADYPGVLAVGAADQQRLARGFLQRQPLRSGRGAGRQRARAGPRWPVLGGQRDEPGMRARRGGGCADQGQVPGPVTGSRRRGDRFHHA